MRGFASGVIWGAVVGALGLVVSSEMAPMPGTPVAATQPAPAEPSAVEPAAPEPTAAEPPAAEAQATGQASSGQDATTGQTVSTEETPTATEPVAPQASSQDVETAAAQDSLEVPSGSEFNRPPAEITPALPEQSNAPAQENVPAVVGTTDVPTPPAADTASAGLPEPSLEGPSAPSAPVGEDSAPELAMVAPPAAPGASPDLAAPAAETSPEAADLPPPPPLTPEEEALAKTAPATEDAGQGDAALPRIISPGQDGPESGANMVETTDQAPEPAKPKTGFENEVPGVKVGALPQIGVEPKAEEETDMAAAPETPLTRNSVDFANLDGKPAFAIILVDDGSPTLDRAALAALPIPVTFALDPMLPDSGKIAETYRKAGHEVVVLATGIPKGATASDLEVTFAAHDAAVPQAVAVLDLPENGFQSDRTLSADVVGIVGASGRGILTYDAGLDSAAQVASRDQVPAARIFRKLDAQGESAPTIRRYLDRAAFKAAQEGSVTVIGSAKPETVATILAWTVEGRASQVALAPVSAVLTTK
ncbi:divergent polysaccharide deacetylase family protein [Tabrizicola sp. J26]|uniref:divergent polysaccharide deacetylase family protein n=1 Tax=Alitabrizicola rongguiensis TaxID=2909234 RepID=UPI001F3903FC|nr:divergent polysaccharide deacetylase family protein [Tabrizicola rongguiensis]MCF1710954.1 divergent polysaccharide deacetylase family protein [Tabrizicola rongguiensis]